MKSTLKRLERKGDIITIYSSRTRYAPNIFKGLFEVVGYIYGGEECEENKASPLWIGHQLYDLKVKSLETGKTYWISNAWIKAIKTL